MNVNWQNDAALALVAVAAIYLARAAWRTMARACDQLRRLRDLPGDNCRPSKPDCRRRKIGSKRQTHRV